MLNNRLINVFGAGCLCAVLAPFASADLPELRAWMQELVEDGEVIGCSAQVTKGGETIFLEAHGDRSPTSEEDLTTDQIVRIYSMTKAITSAALMQLVEQGKVGIDDPVSQYIPSWAHIRVGLGDEAKPAARPVTVRDLLTHTSGLGYGFLVSDAYKPGYKIIDGADGLQDAADRMARMPFLHDPGEGFTYGFNTDVLGRIIEVASGQLFGDYLQANIFEPLNMNDTAFQPPADLQPMHIVSGPPGALAVDEAHYATQATAFRPDFESGGGGLWSTLNDYTRFMMAMERHGELDGARILKPKTVAFMTQNHLSPAYASPQRFGLGFGLNAPVQTRFGPLGGGRWTWGGAASTFFFIDPSHDVTAVFVTQRFPFQAGMGDAFHSETIKALAERNARQHKN